MITKDRSLSLQFRFLFTLTFFISFFCFLSFFLSYAYLAVKTILHLPGYLM